METKVLDIFTDGAAWNNGRANCKGGYGVYIPEMNVRMSEKLESEPSNQRGELMAIKKGLEITKEYLSVKIYTDSMYSMNCATKWCKNWEKNGWKSSKGENVKNQDIIRGILDLMKGREVCFEHVRSHQREPVRGSEEHYKWKGNDIADKLASKSIELNVLNIIL